MASGPVTTPEPLRFGDDFELDPHAYELRRLGRRLKLERIPVELLVLLVEQRGQLVTREQIVERVWGKDVFLDTDNSINAAIRKIRQVLKDDPERPRFVQTVTGRGYRFIAPVREISAAFPLRQAVSEPPAAEESLAGRQISGDRLLAARASRLRPLLLATLIVVLVAAGSYFQWYRSRARPRPSSERVMLAVLPFQNLTGDSSQEYFSDGLAEEMITQLGSLDAQHLGVIGRTSVMLYKSSPKPLDQIGRELGVQYVIDGSVRRDSGHVRITAQLIQVKDQTHVWARQYDRELGSLLTVQSEIAQEIADEIQLRLGDQHNPKPKVLRATASSTTSYDAYDLYLKGRYFWNKRTPDGFRQAADYFQQAIRKDPNYARAYAGLADTFGLMSTWYVGPPNELLPKARVAALRALQLDESLAEAHTSLGLIAENYDYDWPVAEKEFRRAIELNPGYATAHQWYAECLSWQGRFDEALAESDRARQLDPMSLIIAADHGAILYYSRQYERAINQFRTVLEMDPINGHAQGFIVMAYVQQGRFADALNEFERTQPPEDTAWVWGMRAYLYGKWGRAKEAQQALAKFEQLASRMETYRWTPTALAYVGTGKNDQAITALQKLYREHSPAMTCLKVEPVYDPLRGDPRFQDLLHRVGFSD